MLTLLFYVAIAMTGKIPCIPCKPKSKLKSSKCVVYLKTKNNDVRPRESFIPYSNS